MGRAILTSVTLHLQGSRRLRSLSPAIYRCHLVELDQLNMVTTKPLRIEDTLQSFSIAGLEDTTSEQGGMPVEAAMLYATNRTMGILRLCSFPERQNRDRNPRVKLDRA